MSHLFLMDYGTRGQEDPCPVCGHPYDWGDGWFTRPCPRCGAYADTFHPQEYLWSFVRAQGGPAQAARVLGVKEATVKRWLEEGLQPSSWRVFRTRAQKAMAQRPAGREKGGGG